MQCRRLAEAVVGLGEVGCAAHQFTVTQGAACVTQHDTLGDQFKLHAAVVGDDLGDVVGDLKAGIALFSNRAEPL